MSSFDIRLLLAITLGFSSSTSFAGNKQMEAGSLIEHAKQLSDIRAEGAPAFRLRLDFKTIKRDGSELSGTYTEVWVSKTQWRREIVVGDTHRTEVAAGQKRFLLEPIKALPEHTIELPALSDIGTFQLDAWQPDKIENRNLNGASLRCIETLPVIRSGVRIFSGRGSEGGAERPSLCFDRSNGLLAAGIDPGPDRSWDELYLFSDYQKFGDRTYARSYRFLEGEHPRLEAKVVELVSLTQVDQELFAVPNGTKELTGCPDPVRPPRGVYQPEPAGPFGSGVVLVQTTIGIDGATRDLNVAESSGNPKQDKAALEAVRRWRFRPATCDGEPVQMKIAVEIDSHRL